MKATVLIFGSLFAVQCCFTVLAMISRDTIFLKHWPSAYLPSMTLLVAGFTCLLPHLTSNFTRICATVLKCEEKQQMYLFLYSSGGAFLLLWMGLIHIPMLAKFTSAILYVWVELFNQIITQQFWELCGKAFTVKESKQYFGQIAVGSMASSLFTGFILIPSLQYFKCRTEDNLILIAFLLWIFSVLRLSATNYLELVSVNSDVVCDENKRHSKSLKVKSKREKDDTNSSLKSSSILNQIQQRNYFMHLCFFEFGATVLRSLISFQTISVLSKFGEEKVKRTLGMINGVQSCLMIPLQLLSNPLFTNYGVMYGIALLPLAAFIFGWVTSTFQSSVLLIGSRSLYNSISYSIFNTARELLWLPLNNEDRNRIKPFINGPFRSFSKVFGAAVCMGLNNCQSNYFSLFVSICIMAISLVWIIDSFSAKKSYASEFYLSLKLSQFDFNSTFNVTLNQIELIKNILNVGGNSQVRFLLSSLPPYRVHMFSKELHNLFYRRMKGENSKTSQHIKLRLLDLHIASLSNNYKISPIEINTDDISSTVEGSELYTSENEIFSTSELLLMAQLDDDSKVNALFSTRLRCSAILACGYAKSKVDRIKCLDVFRNVLSNKSKDVKDKSIVVCVAITLLRLSGWLEEAAHIELQRLLHEENDIDFRVTCLYHVGKELPELLSTGYLVYLLHHSNHRIVQSALEVCRMRSLQSNATPISNILIPSLVQKLGCRSCRPTVVKTLIGASSLHTWDHLCQFIESTMKLPPVAWKQSHESIVGVLKVLTNSNFPLIAAGNLILSTLETFLEEYDVLGGFCVSGNSSTIEELLGAAIKLIKRAPNNEKGLDLMSRINCIMDLQIRRCYELKYILSMLIDFVECHCSNYWNEDTINSILLLPYLQRSLDEFNRFLLKLVSIHFPDDFNVFLILEGLESGQEEAVDTIQEVLENLLSNAQKNLLLPLLFSNSSQTGPSKRLANEIEKDYEGVSVIEVIKMWIKDESGTLTCLSLDYFIRTVGSATTDRNYSVYQASLYSFAKSEVDILLKNALSREVLYKAIYENSSLLKLFADHEALKEIADKKLKNPHESALESSTCMTKIEVANMLRLSTLFQFVDIIELIEKVSQKVKVVEVNAGHTFVSEGDPGTIMYVIGRGQVRLHKDSKELTILNDGECVGEMALLKFPSHAGEQPASATAVVDSILFGIQRPILDDLIQNSSMTTRGVLNAIASALKWSHMKPLVHSHDSSTNLDRMMKVDSVRLQHLMKGKNNFLKVTTTNLAVNRAANIFLSSIERKANCKSNKTRGQLFLEKKKSYQDIPGMLNKAPSKRSLHSSTGIRKAKNEAYSNLEICIFVQGSKLFSDLDNDHISFVAQLASFEWFDGEEIIYHEGSPAEYLYIVVEGSVKVEIITHPSYNEIDQVNERYMEGDCFGEMGFLKGSSHIDTAKSVGQSEILQILIADFIDIAEKYPTIMHVLLSWLAYQITEKTNRLVGESPSTSTLGQVLFPLGRIMSPPCSPRPLQSCQSVKKLNIIENKLKPFPSSEGIRKRRQTLPH